jgi:Fe-S oxidoreductase
MSPFIPLSRTSSGHLPAWRRDVFSSGSEVTGPADGREIVLFADTLNRAFEPENLTAALHVLVAAGYRVHLPKPACGGRPLCCGRKVFSAGLVDHARAELDRLVETYVPFAARGGPIIGLEPSCLLTLGDELLALRSDATAQRGSAQALLFEEFIAREAKAGRLQLSLRPVARKVLVLGHCHRKSFGAFKPVEQVLRLIPICRSRPSSRAAAAWRIVAKRRFATGWVPESAPKSSSP